MSYERKPKTIRPPSYQLDVIVSMRCDRCGKTHRFGEGRAPATPWVELNPDGGGNPSHICPTCWSPVRRALARAGVHGLAKPERRKVARKGRRK